MRKEAENWFKQGLRDLKSALNANKSGDYYLVVFLCQQAVEKCLKALVIHKQKQKLIEFHSLIFLGKRVGMPKEFHTFLRELTPQYTLTRYPDASNELPSEIYDKKIAERFLANTKKVVEWMKKQVK